MTDDPSDLLIGRKIAGKFAIESYLGGGAMGAVYRARHIALEKTVAVKVMHAELAHDPLFAKRFHREAKAASRLDHPNSIRVIDFGEEPDSLLYIAMEFVDGHDLHQALEDGGLMPPARIVDLLSQTLAALAVAHDMGVVHRDLKPENIMIVRRKDDEGREIDVVKVCDFGIAKLTEPTDDGVKTVGGHLTTTGLVVGTPAYMSPEQGRGEALDARSDLYSMGVILYQLLTGDVPFRDPSPLAVVLKHVSDVPQKPSAIVPSVDPRLEAICLKAMSKAREDRHQTARELRADLRSVLEVAPPSIKIEAAPIAETVTAPLLLPTQPKEAPIRTQVIARPKARPRSKIWLFLGLIMLVGALGGAYVVLQRTGTLARMHVR